MFLIILYIQNDFSSNLLKILQLEFHIIQLFFIPLLKPHVKQRQFIYISFLYSLAYTYMPIPFYWYFYKGKCVLAQIIKAYSVV